MCISTGRCSALVPLAPGFNSKAYASYDMGGRRAPAEHHFACSSVGMATDEHGEMANERGIAERHAGKGLGCPGVGLRLAELHALGSRGCTRSPTLFAPARPHRNGRLAHRCS